jgi:glyoxylase-like metal-dependent hydrolase (beta-lactamase superfamily II)
MIPLASGMSYLDLQFLGSPRVIATVVLQGPGGVALIDPGPSSTLPTLRRTLGEAGIAFADLDAVLLTHIHLDHAGATGTLAREVPRLRVYVHEKGAPHMAQPDKLIASATRLYGADMDRLWGEFRPVPAERMTILRGGERVEAGGSSLEVAYTPGHASHHVSYFSRDTGVALVGDTAGIRRHGDVVLSPTPPPDIDLDLWRASMARIREWAP